MEFTAQMIADFLKGEIEGDPDVKVHEISKIEEGRPGTLTFLSNPKYTKFAYTTEASILLVNKDFVPEKRVKATIIKVENAYQALATLLQMVEQAQPKKEGTDSLACIASSAKTGEKVYIGAFAFIGENVTIGENAKVHPQVYIGDGCKIGENTIIYPGARIYHGCIIGKNCVIHSGAVIGSDGFGFAPKSDKDYQKIPQIGNVILEDEVEIGANATIDRATMGSTIIRRGVKLDNMNHVAHNVEIGYNTVMAAQCGIAGSTRIGENCMFGGQVGIAPHITVANGVKAAAQTGIAGTVKKEDSIIMGAPAFEIGPYRKSYIYFRKLPELVQRLEKLEKDLEERLHG